MSRNKTLPEGETWWHVDQSTLKTKRIPEILISTGLLHNGKYYAEVVLDDIRKESNGNNLKYVVSSALGKAVYEFLMKEPDNAGT